MILHSGAVADIMLRTGLATHMPFRLVRRNENDIVKRRFTEAMFENNTWDFWRGAEKLASNKIKSVSSAVDNVTGCDRVTSLLIYSRK